MVKKMVVLDDVVLALKGKRQEAGEQINLSIPASISATGKRRNVKLDVGDDGKKLLEDAMAEKEAAIEKAQENFDSEVEKLKEKRKKEEQDAWKSLSKIVDKIEDMRPTRTRKKDEDEAVDDSPASDASTTDATQAYAPPASTDYSQPRYGSQPNSDQHSTSQWG